MTNLEKNISRWFYDMRYNNPDFGKTEQQMCNSCAIKLVKELKENKKKLKLKEIFDL